MSNLPSILARAWWRARVGPFPLIGIEDLERSMEHFARILRGEHGIGFTDATGTPLSPPSNPVIWRSPVADANAERELRAGKGVWELVKIADGAEKVLTTTTLQDAALICGLALVGDRAATAPGNMTRLAMGFNVLRLDAAGMEMAETGEEAS